MRFYQSLHSATDTSSDPSMQKDEVKAVLAQAGSSPEFGWSPSRLWSICCVFNVLFCFFTAAKRSSDFLHYVLHNEYRQQTLAKCFCPQHLSLSDPCDMHRNCNHKE